MGVDRQPRTVEWDPKSAVGFATSPVQPGESQDEFESLLNDLRVQYRPEGPIEEDAVRTIANAIWRKGHLEIFQHAFEARMKFGSYFSYPGDPDGFARIAQEGARIGYQQMKELMTEFVTHMVEKELVGTGTDSAENMKGPASLAESKLGDTPAMTRIAMSSALPEGVLKKAAQNAIAKIRASSTVKANRTIHRPMSPEDRARIVRTALQAELETERTAAASEAPRSIGERTAERWDSLEKAFAAMEVVFGHAIVEEIDEKICNRATARELAKLGDLLSPKNYIAELRLNEALDSTIERAHDRLMKYQAWKATKSAANVKSLQSDWVARKRRRVPNHNVIGDA